MGRTISSYDTYNNFYGVFVGIEKFHNSKGRIPMLNNCNDDADQLCHFFLKHCQKTHKNGELCLLTDKDYLAKGAFDKEVKVEEGTRANILDVLSRYLRLIQPDDFLLLYISTHGEIEYNDYFFIPSDGDLDNLLGTGISSHTLIQALGKASSNKANVLMILDTCYSGSIGFDMSKFQGKFSCFLSSSPVEYSYEFFHIDHGVFTKYLLEGLNGQAKEKGVVTLVNLFDYVYKNVQKETFKKQNPLLMGTMEYNFSLL